MHDFFTNGRCLRSINHTLITLKPEVDNPQKPNQSRPISSCNTMYKIVSKILIARLLSILNRIISPFENAFTLGRLIQDDVLIVQEVLNLFNQSKRLDGLHSNWT